MAAREKLEVKLDALDEAISKLEDALQNADPDDRPRIRGRLTAARNESARVRGQINTIDAATPSPPADERELMDAIAAVGRAETTSAAFNGLLTAVTQLISTPPVKAALWGSEQLGMLRS